jgi:RimJ/RimL family protein N-acetyltransferase
MTSKRLKLINCDEKILKLILEGDEYLSKGLNLIIPKKWTEFGESIFNYSLEKIKNNPDSGIWWTYIPVLIESNTLIGSCGFKGEPNNEGVVEIGYEVAEEFRNEGFATEIANLLIRIAFNDKKVAVIQAHTLAEKNASVRVLKKCNFEFVEEIEDEENGTIWKWKLKK